MPCINKVLVAGNLTKEPEVRYTAQGNPVCALNIAINSYYRTNSGDILNKTLFVETIVWGKQVEDIKLNLTKGSSVMVDGRLYTDSWTLKSGEKRSKIKIMANDVVFLP